MKVTLYTLWANIKGEEPMPWMIAAEDEHSWAGNPERCEAVFEAARELAKQNGWDVREIEIEVDDSRIAAAFVPTVVGGDPS